jgi:hypothetical protein
MECVDGEYFPHTEPLEVDGSPNAARTCTRCSAAYPGCAECDYNLERVYYNKMIELADKVGISEADFKREYIDPIY